MNGIPTVKFDPSRVTQEVQNEIRSCVHGIEWIPMDRREVVYRAAVECVSAGGNLAVLFNALKGAETGQKKRALEDACRFISHRASAMMQRDRMLNSGIDQATWRYSGAPCTPGSFSGDFGSDPQNMAHQRADGLSFKIAEGMVLDGKRTWPGWEPDCKCVMQAKIPGF